MAAVAKGADHNAQVTRLFERQSIAAIREIEKSKRQEISAKQVRARPPSLRFSPPLSL